eukprot:SAG31_NODE_2667_length_5273_cov_2.316776_10_plen_107_part_00
MVAVGEVPVPGTARTFRTGRSPRGGRPSARTAADASGGRDAQRPPAGGDAPHRHAGRRAGAARSRGARAAARALPGVAAAADERHRGGARQCCGEVSARRWLAGFC